MSKLSLTTTPTEQIYWEIREVVQQQKQDQDRIVHKVVTLTSELLVLLSSTLTVIEFTSAFSATEEM